MPTPEIHAEIVINSTAASMVTLGAIGHTLGIDPAAMFYAFMGAVCWRAIQPRLAPSFDVITNALGWAVAATLFGSLAAIWAEAIALHYCSEAFKHVPRAVMVGLPAFILSFFVVYLFKKITKLIADWKQP